MSNIEQDGAVYAWNPGATQTTRVTSQVPSIPASPEAEGFARTSSNFFYGLQPPKTPPPPTTSTSGKGYGGGMTASEALALAKFNYDKQQDARKASGLSDYYTGGSYNTGFDALLKMISDQSKVSEGAISGAYDRALQNIGQGYDVAKGLGDQGYSALNAYLAANQNNPYAGMTAQVGSAPDALTNYLSAYGVSDAPVQGQIQADQLQAQQGAGNFQNLINTLSAIAQQGASSRGAESQMAQLLFNTGLGQERAGYTSQAENAQAQALAALQQAVYQSRFGVEQNRNTLAQQLAQTVSELTGTAPTNNNSGSGSDKDNSNPPTAPVEQLLREIAARQQAGTQMDPVLANSPFNPFMQYAV
jgi:hypothetical protein